MRVEVQGGVWSRAELAPGGADPWEGVRGASWRRWPELGPERGVEPSGEGSWGHVGVFVGLWSRVEQDGRETEDQ